VPAFAFARSQDSGDNPEQRDKVADDNIRKPTAHYLPPAFVLILSHLKNHIGSRWPYNAVPVNVKYYFTSPISRHQDLARAANANVSEGEKFRDSCGQRAASVLCGVQENRCKVCGLFAGPFREESKVTRRQARIIKKTYFLLYRNSD